MSQSEIDHALAEKVDRYTLESVPVELIEEALDVAETQLRTNRGAVVEPETDVDAVLAPENVRDIEVRNPGWQDPKVTIWLRDCPTWASWAGTKKLIRIDGRHDLHYVLDIRPF